LARTEPSPLITRLSPLILASRSPRRRELIEQVGIPVEVRTADVLETVRSGESAVTYLQRIVDEKLIAARTTAPADRVILVADTEVVHCGVPLGKPESGDHAEQMLRSLAGNAHEVMTRFAVSVAGRDTHHAETVTTRVFFRALSDAEIAGYVASKEGRDKAGGYAIQGLGAFAIPRIDGSYTNVVGLPVAEVISALLTIGALSRFPLPVEL